MANSDFIDGAVASAATAAVITVLGILWGVHRYRIGRFRGALTLLIGAVILLTCPVAFLAYVVGGTFGGAVGSVIGEGLDLGINVTAASIPIGIGLGIYLCFVVPVGVVIAAFAMAAFTPRMSG